MKPESDEELVRQVESLKAELKSKLESFEKLIDESEDEIERKDEIIYELK